MYVKNGFSEIFRHTFFAIATNIAPGRGRFET